MRWMYGVAGIALTAALSGCSPTSPSERAQELDRVYTVGQDARKQMTDHGLPVTDESCDQMFTSTGNDDYSDSDGFGNKEAPPKGFSEQRRAFYVSGCMNRPKSGIAPTTTATSKNVPEPSPSNS